MWTQVQYYDTILYNTVHNCTEYNQQTGVFLDWQVVGYMDLCTVSNGDL